VKEKQDRKELKLERFQKGCVHRSSSRERKTALEIEK
jgi:hypothetical protein